MRLSLVLLLPLLVGIVPECLHAQELSRPAVMPLSRKALLDSLNLPGPLYDSARAGVARVTGAGPRLIWSPGLAAFRAGEVSNSDTLAWDSAKTGKASTAFGYGTTASGQFGLAEGYGTISSGRDAHGEGYLTLASGTNSHAEGDNAVASGLSAHAEGHYTTGSGWGSHAEGGYSIATGPASHAGGNHAKAYLPGQWAFASGTTTNTPGVAQSSLIILRGRSSGGSPVELKCGGGDENVPSYDPIQQLVVPIGKAWYFRIHAVAKTYSGDATMSGFRSEGIISYNGSATTLLGGGVTTVTGRGAGLTLTIDADTTTHALRVTGTGVDGVTINWVGEAELTEVAAD